jgi:hypothetical protein
LSNSHITLILKCLEFGLKYRVVFIHFLKGFAVLVYALIVLSLESFDVLKYAFGVVLVILVHLDDLIVLLFLFLEHEHDIKVLLFHGLIVDLDLSVGVCSLLNILGDFPTYFLLKSRYDIGVLDKSIFGFGEL